VDANNRLNGVSNSFDPFNNKLSLENKLIDLYSIIFIIWTGKALI